MNHSKSFYLFLYTTTSITPINKIKLYREMATGEKSKGERNRFFTTQIHLILKSKLKILLSKASTTAHTAHSGQYRREATQKLYLFVNFVYK